MFCCKLLININIALNSIVSLHRPFQMPIILLSQPVIISFLSLVLILFLKESPPLVVRLAPLACDNTNMPGNLLAVGIQVNRQYYPDFWTGFLLWGKFQHRRSELNNNPVILLVAISYHRFNSFIISDAVVKFPEYLISNSSISDPVKINKFQL